MRSSLATITNRQVDFASRGLTPLVSSLKHHPKILKTSIAPKSNAGDDIFIRVSARVRPLLAREVEEEDYEIPPVQVLQS